MPRATRPVKAPKPLEADVQKAVLGVLEAMGVFAWRQNTLVAPLVGKNGRIRPYRSNPNGVADIVGVLPGGRHLEIEVKRPGKRPEPHQLERLRTLNSLGAVAFWVDDPMAAHTILTHVLRDQARVWIDSDGNPRLKRTL